MTSEQKAYVAIRHGIAAGVYHGGSHLPAAELAASLGISRTPIREALRRLHAEGLVDFHAHRGAFVSKHTAEDVEDVFGLRIVLEGHAAGLAALRLDAADVGRLIRYTDEMERSFAETARAPTELARANDDFHATIIAAAASKRLAAMIASVVEMSWITRTFGIYSEDDLHASIFHHREMIRAFYARDAVWATAVMQGHIRAAYHVFMASTTSRP